MTTKLDREKLVEVMARAIARTHSSADGLPSDAGWRDYLPDARAARDALIAELPDPRTLSDMGIIQGYIKLKRMGKHDGKK